MSIAVPNKPVTIELTDSWSEIIPAPAAGKVYVVKGIQFTNVDTNDETVRAYGALKDSGTVQAPFLHACPITKDQNAISGLIEPDLFLVNGVSIHARAEAVDTLTATVFYVEIDA